jgi:hypothetical protein
MVPGWEAVRVIVLVIGCWERLLGSGCSLFWGRFGDGGL